MKKYKFKINGNTYHVNIQDTSANLIQLEVNGSSYEVQMETEVKTTKTPTLIRSEPRLTQRVEPLSTSASTHKITSPLPGVILNIMVKEGDAVKTGDPLVILEAMKMENTILAESAGVVKSVKVTPQKSVLQGDLLLEIG